MLGRIEVLLLVIESDDVISINTTLADLERHYDYTLLLTVESPPEVIDRPNLTFLDKKYFRSSSYDNNTIGSKYSHRGVQRLLCWLCSKELTLILYTNHDGLTNINVSCLQAARQIVSINHVQTILSLFSAGIPASLAWWLPR